MMIQYIILGNTAQKKFDDFNNSIEYNMVR